MVTTVFISRTLDSGSPLNKFLTSQNIKSRKESLILFSPKPFDFPNSEWLFFYSKNGVKFFVEATGKSNEAKRNYKCLAYGPATAELCSKYYDVGGHGNSDAHQSLELIQRYTSLESITFVRGEKSMHSVQSVTEVKLDETVVYNNLPKKNVNLGHYFAAILTSPMNAHAFFDNGGTAENYISIGKSTARVFEQSSLPYSIAEKPTEVGILKTLMGLFEK